ncbi:MAG TPA: ImmA/IrrE family metallo-endopeptidase [Anaerolineae bacterium]|nr:ImmA/IrrE family metallo-endopeptidase [Anaerolineae bacterium]
MAKIVRALITPEVLVWAREQAGLSIEEAARKVGVSPERLASWESGASRPTVRQLRLLGKAYRRPSAFFYLSKPPIAPVEITDFRRAVLARERKPPALLYEIRRAHFRRQIALDLLAEMEEQPPLFEISFSLHDDPVLVGARIRECVAVDVETQVAWRDSYEALSGWINAIERCGVLVFQYGGVEVDIARGFSISEYPLPVISLNARDAAVARIFTLLHECCHLVIDQSGLCDLYEENGKHVSVEIFCNAVAAEVLVPREALLSQPEVGAKPDGIRWSDEMLQALGKRFKVSREVILRRLLTLGRTTKDFYQRKREEWLEECESVGKRRGGFLQYHRRVLRDNGRKFTSLLFEAYRQKLITAYEVSRYLGGVRLEHIKSIEYDLI